MSLLLPYKFYPRKLLVTSKPIRVIQTTDPKTEAFVQKMKKVRFKDEK
jgi:hypothetical protein